MKKSRFTEEQIIYALRLADSGKAVVDVCRHVQPDFGRLHQELRRKGMTRMLLWEEYRADYASSQTYSYSQFCDNYRRFAK